jgi:hypothetical protein
LHDTALPIANLHALAHLDVNEVVVALKAIPDVSGKETGASAASEPLSSRAWMRLRGPSVCTGR